ncbi:MAG: glutamate--tRNA ligase [Candidatus Gottesmanbacteria bacterium]|nr:glutamate--tRNA ligase [Candidatus Gottesmanbacteria bacterium]
MKPVRTRIAPSPTGENLHIGNAYTALINYVVARQNNGQFIIRIEDTDRTRFVEGSETRILESLSWLGIPHDEGPDNGGPFTPYRQSDRLAIYKQYAEELVKKDHAYYCFCTPERLSAMRKDQEARHEAPKYDGHCRKVESRKSPARNATQSVAGGKVESEKYVIRLKVPEEGTTTFTDLIRGEISFENKLIDDQVILKSDGYPTYHLGVVVDDHLMEISHIIRGEEWISSTPKHILLYKFFGWEPPIYAHMPLLRNPDKSKLSKRKNPVWVSWYKEQGFLPEAVVNYLATIAWTHPDGKELFTILEMIRVFDLKKIQTTAPVFDLEKLRWMNGEYLRRSQKSPARNATQSVAGGKVKSQIFDFYHGKYDEAIIEKTLSLVIERIKTLGEYEMMAGFFFERPKVFERPINKKLLTIAQETLETCIWNHDAMEKAIREAADKAKMKAKDVFMELRVAVTGKTVGPPLLESLELLGKEETLTRLS